MYKNVLRVVREQCNVHCISVVKLVSPGGGVMVSTGFLVTLELVGRRLPPYWGTAQTKNANANMQALPLAA